MRLLPDTPARLIFRLDLPVPIVFVPERLNMTLPSTRSATSVGRVADARTRRCHQDRRCRRRRSTPRPEHAVTAGTDDSRVRAVAPDTRAEDIHGVAPRTQP